LECKTFCFGAHWFAAVVLIKTPMADISPAPASQDDALCNLVLKALSVPGSEITEMATFAEQNNVDLTALSNAVKRLTSQGFFVELE